MAWRYRRRIKIAPGVHLNVSKKGFSTTIGVRGASVNFGRNGTYVNTGIPGTGFYNRQKISGSTKNKKNYPIAYSEHNQKRNQNYSTEKGGCFFIIFMIIISIICIRCSFFFFCHGTFSFFIGFMLFVIGIGGFYTILEALFKDNDKKLIKRAKTKLPTLQGDAKNILQNFVNCFELSKKIATEERLITSLEQELNRNKSSQTEFLYIDHKKILDSYKEQLAKKQLDVDATLTEEEKVAYSSLCEKFKKLLGTNKVWSITYIAQSISTKSWSERIVNRKDALLYVGVFNFLKSDFDIPVFDAGDTQYYIYPKFIIKVNSVIDFVVFPYSLGIMTFATIEFQENRDEPEDAIFIRTSWKHENKNGEPDRRYSDNIQMPLLNYYHISLHLGEFQPHFLLSNINLALEFATAYTNYLNCLFKNK